MTHWVVIEFAGQSNERLITFVTDRLNNLSYPYLSAEITHRLPSGQLSEPILEIGICSG